MNKILDGTKENEKQVTPHHYVFILTFTIYIVVISFRH